MDDDTIDSEASSESQVSISRSNKLDTIVASAQTILVDDKPRLLCQSCNKTFYDRAALRVHYSSAHLKITYRCTVEGCGMWFNSLRSRNRHSVNHNPLIHREMPAKPPPDDAIFIEEGDSNGLDQGEDQDVKPFESVSKAMTKGGGEKRPQRSAVVRNDVKKRRIVGEEGDSTGETISEKNQKVDSDSQSSIEPVQATLGIVESLLAAQEEDTKPMLTSAPVAKVTEELCDSVAPRSNPSPPTSVSATATSVTSGEGVLRVEEDSNDARMTLRDFVGNLLDTLTAQDPNGFYLYPMTEAVAPGCSKILENLTSLSTIRNKLLQDAYRSVSEVREDLDLLYTNGMRYHQERSAQYREAAKLLKLAYDMIDQTGAFSAEEAEEEEAELDEYAVRGLPPREDLCTDEQGRASLNIINPGSRGIVSETERVQTFGEQVGKLRSGTVALNGYKEDRRNKVTPLTYLDYGPFCSFGPVYDSSGAQCTKADSDLLLSNYVTAGCGEDDVTQMLIPEPGMEDDFSLYLANALTQDLLLEERAKRRLVEEAAGTPETSEVEPSVDPVQARLDEVADNLVQLQAANHRRLGQPALYTRPSNQEMLLANRVVSGLTGLVGWTNPREVVSVAALRRAMGVEGVSGETEKT